VSGWWTAESRPVTGVFLLTPQLQALLRLIDTEGAASPAQAWDTADVLPGATGEAVTAFADAWWTRSGLRVELPGAPCSTEWAGSPARPRTARSGAAGRAGDRELLRRWYDAFDRETGEPGPHVGRMVDDRLAYGRLTLWTADGRPVSFACLGGPAVGAIRVLNVHSPPELRGRGFAGAPTTAVGQAALDTCPDEVLLFTDLACPANTRCASGSGTFRWTIG
jgi:hypothetical protein